MNPLHHELNESSQSQTRCTSQSRTQWTLSITNSMHLLNHKPNESSQSRTQRILSITNSMHLFNHELNESPQTRTQWILSNTNSMNTVNHELNEFSQSRTQCILSITNSVSHRVLVDLNETLLIIMRLSFQQILSITNSMNPLNHELNASSQSRTMRHSW